MLVKLSDPIDDRITPWLDMLESERELADVPSIDNVV